MADRPLTPPPPPDSRLASMPPTPALKVSASSVPQLLHTLRTDSSVLALTVSEATATVYAGTQDGKIVTWSIDTFADCRHVQAHRHSVLCLALSSDDSVLVSGAADPFVNVWCPRSLARLYEIYSVHDIGDVFSLACSARSSTVFLGSQNASIQWIQLPSNDAPSAAPAASPATTSLSPPPLLLPLRPSSPGPPLPPPPRGAMHPDLRNHRFFDSKAFGNGATTPRRSHDRWADIPRAAVILEIDPLCVRPFAHYGYVYCMLVATSPTVLVDPGEEVVVSGGGDGTIKLWQMPRRPHSVVNGHGHGHAHGHAHNHAHNHANGHSHAPELAPENAQDAGSGPNGPTPSAPTIEEIMVLGSDDGESVLSLVLDRSFLYAGKLGGLVELWDLDTKQKLRVIRANRGDITTLQVAWGCLWTASTIGSASRHSIVQHEQTSAPGIIRKRYCCLSRWQAHGGKILSSAIITRTGHNLLVTGANDNSVAVWHVRDEPGDVAGSDTDATDDGLVASLAEFVSYKTVSSRPEYAEDCRHGANFLATLFQKMGGQVQILGPDQNHQHDSNHHNHLAGLNPVVLATFSGKTEPASKSRRRILFYGHYDVVPAEPTDDAKWDADPFRMRGLDGFLYGRGVSDNKGPILAALYAVADLVEAQTLDNDIIFLIEGEEETGSRGFQQTVRRHRHLIGPVDYILLANSYWLDDEVPCLTYGLRGVLHATVQVVSPHPDMHSGVDGCRLLDEPLSDLTRLLARLKGPGNRVAIPAFYDSVLTVTPEEDARYDEIVATQLAPRSQPQPQPLQKLQLQQNQEQEKQQQQQQAHQQLHQQAQEQIQKPEQAPAPTAVSSTAAAELKASLMARWREPNLTIHRYQVSGPDGSLVSSRASAHISLRLVPRQGVDATADALAAFLTAEFAALGTANTLTVRTDNRADAWLGDPTGALFRTLEAAVVRAWGLDRRPLYIREGGSIPAIRFLETEFGAPAAHLPCGQASDAAHLHNERLRLLNLLKSREIFAAAFSQL